MSKHSSIWSWPSQRGGLQQWLDGAYLCLIAVMSAEATVVSPFGGAGFGLPRPNFIVYFWLVAVGGVHPDFAVLAFSIDSLNSCAVMAVRVLVLEKLPLARVIMLRASAA